MKHFFRHLFTPHHSNNHRARLLHNSSLFILACLLLVSGFGIGIIKDHTHDVLGTTANISSSDLLNLTNVARNAAGLPSLHLDSQLSQAAAGKAEDMFTNNYWAHVSPSGVTPWDFIRGAGYNYSYAGENLARGYDTANDAMNAWMNSPEHKANILSPNYDDVGFAVAQGTLTGDIGTVLIVEEFGRRAGQQSVIQNPVPVVQAQAKTLPSSVQAAQEAIPTPTVAQPTSPAVPSVQPTAITSTPFPGTLTQVTNKPLIDSKRATKTIGIILLGILIVLLLLDLLIMGKKKLVRIVGHNLDHIIFFVTIIIIALLLGQGIVF